MFDSSPEMDQTKCPRKENTEKVPHQPAWCDENFISTRVLVRKTSNKSIDSQLMKPSSIMGQPSSIMGRNSLNNFWVHICTYCKLCFFCLVPERLSIPSLSWGMCGGIEFRRKKNDRFFGGEQYNEIRHPARSSARIVGNKLSYLSLMDLGSNNSMGIVTTPK